MYTFAPGFIADARGVFLAEVRSYGDVEVHRIRMLLQVRQGFAIEVWDAQVYGYVPIVDGDRLSWTVDIVVGQ